MDEYYLTILTLAVIAISVIVRVAYGLYCLGRRLARTGPDPAWRTVPAEGAFTEEEESSCNSF